RYYTPDNATVVVVGDFDKADTLAQLSKAYSGWKGKLDPAPVPREPRQNGSRRAAVPWKAPTVPRLYMAWHGRGADDLHAAAVQAVLAPYLFGETSVVYQELVLKRQIVDSISPQDGVNRDPSLLGAIVRVKDEKNLRQSELTVLREVSNLARGRVDAGRLAAIKSNVRYSIIAALDKPDSVANALVQNTALTGDVDYLNALAREIDALTPAMLQEYGKRAFLDANRTTVTLTPQVTRAQRKPAAGRARPGRAGPPRKRRRARRRGATCASSPARPVRSRWSRSRSASPPARWTIRRDRRGSPRSRPGSWRKAARGTSTPERSSS